MATFLRWMLSGAGAMLAAQGALAAGSVGIAPAGGFSIDDLQFDPANVVAAPCPAGSTCITLPGSDAGFLQREITDSDTGVRTLQTIVAEIDGDATFANEARIGLGAGNAIAAKLRIDDPWIDPERAFFTEHTLWRGAFDANGGAAAIELVQTLGGGTQRFEMELPDIPGPGGIMTAGRIAIDQAGDDGPFAHRVLRGPGYAPTDFALAVTDGVDTHTLERAGAAPGGLTATYVHAMLGDELSAFLIYRFFSADIADGAITAGETTTGGVATEEIRASTPAAGGLDASDMGWDETLFGPAP